jgi:hypothetical protein
MTPAIEMLDSLIRGVSPDAPAIVPARLVPVLRPVARHSPIYGPPGGSRPTAAGVAR